MKKRTLTLLLLPLVISCHSQTNQPPQVNEFGNYSNGLMYADTTMKALRHMVDSLNIRFKSCVANPTYLSRPQGVLWSVQFASTNSDLKDVRKDIGAKMDFDDLIRKYPQFIQKTDTLLTIIKFSYPDNENEDEQVSYLVGTPHNGYENHHPMGDLKNNRTVGKWTYYYSPKDKYDSFNRLECRFQPSGLKQQKIPAEYANYIAYVDCMIDTNSVISQAGPRTGWSFSLKELPEASELNRYLNRKMKLKREKDDNSYMYDYITAEKYKYAGEYLRNDPQFISLVTSVADACIEKNTGTDVLEDLIANFISKQKALELKRHRRVIGLCSQDQSPRFHARNIAVLAAETNSWDIFLRAHMDIMNDRFERMSDGSYAYGGRKTYLKELEALNLNIVDLMIGLSLRAENTAENHYKGTVWRLGWALSESKDTALFEARAIQMMKDDRLDNFNRGLMFLLYKTYLSSLPDITLANKKINRLKKDVRSYPKFIGAAIDQLKEVTSR